jgi:hypothetical protein
VPGLDCWVVYCAGELRGAIAFPSLVGTASLSGAQQPNPVSSTATGVGIVVLASPLTVNVSLSLIGLANQTMAHLHLAGVDEHGIRDAHVRCCALLELCLVCQCVWCVSGVCGVVNVESTWLCALL